MSKHPLEGLFSAIAEEIKSQLENNDIKVVVATATEAQSARLQAIRYRMKDLETEMERLMSDFTIKLEREHKPKYDKIIQEHKDAWREMEEAHGLNHNKDYGLNHKKLEIYERIQPKEKNRNGGLKH